MLVHRKSWWNPYCAPWEGYLPKNSDRIFWFDALFIQRGLNNHRDLQTTITKSLEWLNNCSSNWSYLHFIDKHIRHATKLPALHLNKTFICITYILIFLNVVFFKLFLTLIFLFHSIKPKSEKLFSSRLKISTHKHAHTFLDTFYSLFFQCFSFFVTRVSF